MIIWWMEFLQLAVKFSAFKFMDVVLAGNILGDSDSPHTNFYKHKNSFSLDEFKRVEK